MQSHHTTSQTTNKKFTVTVVEALELHILVLLKWAVSTTWFLLLLVIILVGISLLASLLNDSWHWFQRSGALMVSIGAVLSTRRVLGFMLDSMIDHRHSKIMLFMQGTPHQSEIGELRTRVCGFMLVVMGTMIWAYGDLLGYLFE